MEEKNIKETLEQEFKKIWKDGYQHGVATTCATLFKTFHNAGLAPDNILFSILEDWARSNGCEDLKAYIETMDKNKQRFINY